METGTVLIAVAAGAVTFFAVRAGNAAAQLGAASTQAGAASTQVGAAAATVNRVVGQLGDTLVAGLGKLFGSKDDTAGARSGYAGEDAVEGFVSGVFG